MLFVLLIQETEISTILSATCSDYDHAFCVTSQHKQGKSHIQLHGKSKTKEKKKHGRALQKVSINYVKKYCIIKHYVCWYLKKKMPLGKFHLELLPWGCFFRKY